MRIRVLVSLLVAATAAVALVSVSGAGTGKVQRVARIDVSSKAAVLHYLRSIHVNPRGVVIQRGARNYAGPNCPGKGWHCTSTLRTVVQVARPGGKNVFRCKTTRCSVLQISKSPLADNTAYCVKTTGVTQSCTINQPNSTGTNTAIVFMDTGKLTGLTQTALYTASITQGPSSSTGSTNTNLACVHQRVWIDGSTNNVKSSAITVANEAHQSISISQDSKTGSNTVEDAVSTGKSAACATSALSQYQLLTSTATGKGTVVQKQNALDNGANVDLSIKQNQGADFLNNAGVIGENTVAFSQTNSLTAIANAPTGATQIQSSPNGGILAAVNQWSTGLSTANANQEETQCQDADKTGLTTCNTTNAAECAVASPPPFCATLSQTQYGPVRKAPGDSTQSGNGDDTFTITQSSKQDNDTHSGQTNLVAGGITTDGTGTVTQNTLIQGTPKKDVQQGENTTVNGNINCSGSACTKTLSAPKITSNPPNPDTYGSTATFNFSNVDDTVAFVCSLDGAAYTACGNPPPSGLGTISYSNLASGAHTFSVKTKDPDNGNLSAAASYSWVITPPDPTITDNPPNPSSSTSASFTLHDADVTALFKCQLDGGGYTSCTSPKSYTGLSAGEHTFDVKATDASGTYESAGSASYTWTIAYVVFDGSVGTGAPPSTLGPYAMTGFGADSQSVGTAVSGVADPAGTIGFSPSLQHDRIGSGWATWSNGYTGDVYDTCSTQPGPSCAAADPSEATITLPAGTNAFYLYAEPNHLTAFTITAIGDDGTTSGPVSVTGNGGAKYFGFYGLGGATISSITVSTDDSLGFAVGEFGINVAAP